MPVYNTKTTNDNLNNYVMSLDTELLTDMILEHHHIHANTRMNKRGANAFLTNTRNMNNLIEGAVNMMRGMFVIHNDAMINDNIHNIGDIGGGDGNNDINDDINGNNVNIGADIIGNDEINIEREQIAIDFAVEMSAIFDRLFH